MSIRERRSIRLITTNRQERDARLISVHLGSDLSAGATNKGFHLTAISVAVSMTCPSISAFYHLDLPVTEYPLSNWDLD